MKYLFGFVLFGLFSFVVINECRAGEIASTIPIKSDNQKYQSLSTLYSPLSTYKNKQFFKWINTKSFTRKISSSEEKKLARKSWKKGLGVDVFYPYFELKKAKSIIEDKTEVSLFKMKGKARIERDEIKYIFRARF